MTAGRASRWNKCEHWACVGSWGQQLDLFSAHGHGRLPSGASLSTREGGWRAELCARRPGENHWSWAWWCLSRARCALIVCFQLLPHPARHLRPRSQLPSRATLATGEPATEGRPPSRASSNSWSHRVGRGPPGLLGRILKNKSPLGPGIPCELR